MFQEETCLGGGSEMAGPGGAEAPGCFLGQAGFSRWWGLLPGLSDSVDNLPEACRVWRKGAPRWPPSCAGG